MITINQIYLIRQVLDYIGDSIDGSENCDGMRVNFVASHYGYSPFHFHRMFKRIVDMSVTDYIREKRLERAAGLLVNTPMGVLDICIACGFDSPQTFNRAFKRRFDLTPGEYRRRKELPEPLSPERILRKYYYRLAKGAYPMLKPYIVERDAFLLVGQRVTLGGSSPSKEGIGYLWENADAILSEIHSKASEHLVYGVSLDFQYGPERDEDARHSYLVAQEVSKVERMAFDHESLVLAASKWVYIPVRGDDPFVKSLAPPEKQDDFPYLVGSVFGWSGLWCKENGYEPCGYPYGLEIYGLDKGYEGEGGPFVTVCVPVK